MNKQEAEYILYKFSSKHTDDIDDGYDAEFNIKVHLGQWIIDLTDHERQYINSSFEFVMEHELECLIEQIKEDKFSPVECWQEGRSGGWLVCRFPAPENGLDIIKLARAVQRISKIVEQSVKFVKSEEFWRCEMEANMPPDRSKDTLRSVLFDMGDHTAWFNRVDSDGKVYDAGHYEFKNNAKNMTMIGRLEELGYRQYPYGNVNHCIMVNPVIKF